MKFLNLVNYGLLTIGSSSLITLTTKKTYSDKNWNHFKDFMNNANFIRDFNDVKITWNNVLKSKQSRGVDGKGMWINPPALSDFSKNFKFFLNNFKYLFAVYSKELEFLHPFSKDIFQRAQKLHENPYFIGEFKDVYELYEIMAQLFYSWQASYNQMSQFYLRLFNVTKQEFLRASHS